MSMEGAVMATVIGVTDTAVTFTPPEMPAGVYNVIVLCQWDWKCSDTTTPILKFLLIDGGKLMYDRDADGLNLNSEFILIINGGALEIGTEDEPYLHQATITMHGHVRCTELPVYGCKSIGAREGSLDLHGEFVPMTWTYLAATVEATAAEITLVNGVNWKPQWDRPSE